MRFSEQDMIKMLRLMSHDYMNHFQVIAGYLQLGRTQQALDYLRDIVDAVSVRHNIFRWIYPATALSVVLWQLRFFEGTKKLVVRTGTDLRDIAVAEDLLTDLLDSVLNTIYTIDQEMGGEDWVLRVEDRGNDYVFGVEYLGEGIPDLDWNALQDRAAGMGCRLKQDPDKGHVLLICPKVNSSGGAE